MVACAVGVCAEYCLGSQNVAVALTLYPFPQNVAQATVIGVASSVAVFLTPLFTKVLPAPKPQHDATGATARQRVTAEPVL
ncbi:hypothetical protein [Corynebacterium uterequi]|uniref:hypothetical protein n=1 Tax=Corynebacterium uterequi TaxID=1072256 RepID=UPI0011876B27|nr:hypothetical protein [Corynebacterium uterequi]